MQVACRKVVDTVDDCLAVGVVDLGTGMVMGVHHIVPHFTQTYIDAVAAAAVEFFRGKAVRRIEELLGQQRGEPIKDSFEEVFVSSAKVFHFMMVIKDKSAAVIMVTRKSTNQGLGWSGLRNSIPAIRAAIP